MCLGTHRTAKPVLLPTAMQAVEGSLSNAIATLNKQQYDCQHLERSPAPLDDTKIPQSITEQQEEHHTTVHHSEHPRHGHRHSTGVHIIVQHNYHDHSHDTTVAYKDEHPVRGGVSVPFPLKLHQMLDSVKRNGCEDIVSWQPHGRCFVIHKPRELVELLPRYFKLSKLASFQRQLNLYGFQRLTRGPDRGGYYHELFLRGKPDLAHTIQRTKVKGTCVRARSNPQQEPNFWTMDWMEEERDDARSPPSLVADTSSSSFVYPGTWLGPSMVTASIVPIVSPPTGARKQVIVPSADATPMDDDTVYAFGNKTFHELDVFQPLSSDDFKWQPSTYGAQTSTADAENFFQDFQFPFNIGVEVENDAIFGEMLQSLIAL